MVLWVNLHGGFAVGLLLIVLTLVGILLDGWVEGRKWQELWPGLRTLLLVLIGLRSGGGDKSVRFEDVCTPSRGDAHTDLSRSRDRLSFPEFSPARKVAFRDTACYRRSVLWRSHPKE